MFGDGNAYSKNEQCSGHPGIPVSKLSRWGALSIIAVVFWGFADSPRSAILLAASGDAFAALPTITKAWKFPETETGITYIASLVSVALVLPSIPVWNIENAAFQVCLLAINSLIVLSVYRQRLGLEARASRLRS